MTISNDHDMSYKNNDLIWLLRVQLAEALNLQVRMLIYFNPNHTGRVGGIRVKRGSLLPNFIIAQCGNIDELYALKMSN